MTASRVPPHALELERAILGAGLLEGRVALDRLAATPLGSGDFYLEKHRELWATVLALYEADEPIDALTVATTLARGGRPSLVDPPYLAQLLEEAAVASHLEAYAEQVVDLAKLRDLAVVARRTAEEAWAGKRKADDLLGALAADTDRLARRTLGEEYDPATSWTRIVASWKRGVVKSGLAALDAMTAGFTRGEIVTIGGRTSHGKTAFALNRAKAMAQAGVRVEYLTLEESVAALTRRMAADEAEVPIFRLRDGSCSPAEFVRLERAIRGLQELPLTIRGVESIRSRDEAAVLGAVSLSRADVTILDHIHKVQVRRRKGEEMTYAIGRVVDRLHEIGLRDGKVILNLAQLGREMERQRRPPVLMDLRDSSTLEAASRIVLLAWWPWKANPQADPEEYVVFVAKHSEGGTGPVKLRTVPQYGRFLPVEG